MKAFFRALTATLGIALTMALFAGAFAAPASAQCMDPGLLKKKKGASLRKQSWTGGAVPASLLLASYRDRRLENVSTDASDEPIVGFWKETFIAGDNDQGIPHGAVIDAGFGQWHSDGTEIHNSSGRPPLTQSFCLGVWKKVGLNKYRLNHFALSWDSSGTTLVGPANIQEEITVSSDHKSFDGTFTIDQYDTSGTRLAHITGEIRGMRITMKTTIDDVL